MSYSRISRMLLPLQLFRRGLFQGPFGKALAAARPELRGESWKKPG